MLEGDGHASGSAITPSARHLTDPVHRELLAAFVHFFRDWDKDAYCLEIGCGDGFWMETLRNLGFERTVGIDRSRTLLERAAEKGLDVRYGDLRDLEVTDVFDIVLFCDTLGHVEDPAEGLQRAHRALRQHGCLYVMAPVYESAASRWNRSVRGANLGRQSAQDDAGRLHHFDMDSLVAFIERNGFTVESEQFVADRTRFRGKVRRWNPDAKRGDWAQIHARNVFVAQPRAVEPEPFVRKPSPIPMSRRPEPDDSEDDRTVVEQRERSR